MERGVLTVLEHMHTDLPPGELFRIAQAVAQVDPQQISGCVVQGGIGDIGGASVPSLPRPGPALRRRGAQGRHDRTMLNVTVVEVRGARATSLETTCRVTLSGFEARSARTSTTGEDNAAAQSPLT